MANFIAFFERQKKGSREKNIHHAREIARFYRRALRHSQKPQRRVDHRPGLFLLYATAPRPTLIVSGEGLAAGSIRRPLFGWLVMVKLNHFRRAGS